MCPQNQLHNNFLDAYSVTFATQSPEDHRSCPLGASQREQSHNVRVHSRGERCTHRAMGSWKRDPQDSRPQHNRERGSLLCDIENIYGVFILRDSGKDNGGEDFW